MKTIGVYIRKSREDTNKKNNSIKEQRLLGSEFCENNNFKPVFYDDGIISGVLKNRQQFQKMITDIKDNKLDGLFIWNTDRLARDVGAFENLAEAMRDTNTLLYDNGVEIDLNQPNQSMLYTMKSAMDAHYAKVTQSKIKTVLNRNFKTGKSHGRDTFGYTKDLNNYIIIDDEEADIVRLIFNKSLNGHTPLKISKYLNEKNIKTKYNKLGGKINITNKYTGKTITKNKEDIKWAESTVRKILTNPIYRGERIVRHKNKNKFETKSYNAPIIIESELWHKVNEKFSKTNSGKKSEYKYLLNSLLECARCGRNYYGRVNKSNNDNYYMCSSKRYKDKNCGNNSINRPKFDDFVWDVLNSTNLIKEIDLIIKQGTDIEEISEIKKELDALNKEVKSITKQKNIAIDLIIKEIATQEETQSTMNGLNAKLKSVDEKIINKKEELEYLLKSKSEMKTMKSDLSSLEKDIPYEIKQKTLKKHIKRIYIESSDNNLYEVLIEFRVRSINKAVYVINRSFGMVRTVLPHINELKDRFYQKYGKPKDKIDIRGEYGNSTFKNEMIDRIRDYEPKMRQYNNITKTFDYVDNYEYKGEAYNEYLEISTKHAKRSILKKIEDSDTITFSSDEVKKQLYNQLKE